MICKVHPKFPQIEISKDGTIFSVKTGKPRRLGKKKLGYLQLSVGRSSYLAHRLIADVWVQNPLNKPEINHKNGKRDDNRADNLEWCTRRENILHARDVLGAKFSVPGFQSSAAKVTEKENRIIKRLWNEGFSQKKIAEITEYSIPTIVDHLGKQEGNTGCK